MFILLKKYGIVKPWESERAKELDSMNIHSWVKSEFRGKETVVNAEHTGMRGLLASEPEDVSFLFWLSYIAKAVDGRVIPLLNGNMAHLGDTFNGAQQDKLVRSAWNISQQLYSKFVAPFTEFNSAVVSVEYEKNNSVIVQTLSGKKYKGGKVIFAIPPVLCEKIIFTPQLPSRRLHLQQKMTMGSVIKMIIFYSVPFWKNKRLSGLSISNNPNGIQLSYDASVLHPSASKGKSEYVPAMAVFFLGAAARKASELTQKERENIADQFLRYLFNAEKDPTIRVLTSVENDWCQELWSGGGYTGVLPPGGFTQCGEYLTKPLYDERLFWCGTETATEWPGYFEGALQAGERVVQQMFPASKL